MSSHRTLQFKLLGTALVLLGIVAACSSQYEPEDFNISATDEMACELLSDSLAIPLSASSLTEFNPDWDTTSIVMNNISAVMDSLESAGHVFAVRTDTAYSLQLPADEDTSYLYLHTGLNDGGTVALYLTEVADLSLYKRSGDPLSLSITDMPLETVAGCMIDTLEQPAPLIEIRREYMLDASDALVQIIATDQTQDPEIRALVAEL